MKRWIRAAALALALAVLCCAFSLAEGGGFRTLQLGDTGEDVMALKQRMWELGYFSSNKFAAEFNKTTRERLIELQKKNGLPADGIATPEVQALIFSDACLGKKDSANAQSPSSASPAPVNTGKAQLPALDGEGYLPAGEAPYAYASREEGLWIYISSSVHIEIRQQTAKGPRKWLEAHIRLREGAALQSLLSSGKKPGTSLVQPEKIMTDNDNPVFAFNDDFFGYRLRYKDTVGVIIRGGEILYDKARSAGSTKFPPLDVMAVFGDGTMKTFLNGEHTAQEYVDMGVVDTYAFGPALIREGQINPAAANFGTNDSPRVAMGMTAEGEIIVLDVLGRRKDAVGVPVSWVADKMLELGCVEAINLDGGNTSCMIFLGDMINRPVNTAKKDIRYITGLIAVKEDAE